MSELRDQDWCQVVTYQLSAESGASVRAVEWRLGDRRGLAAKIVDLLNASD